jgi:archaeal preflagellin peptidase FlaK
MSAIPPAIEWASLAVSFGVLIAASISDMKTREVSDRVWMIYGPIGLILFIARIIYSPVDAPIFLVSAIATIVVAFLLFQFGVMGGADTKALMCIGLALPVEPGVIASFWQPPFVFYPFPIAILVNSFLLSVALAVFIFARNLVRGVSANGLFRGFERESVIRKLVMLLTSYKTSFNALQSRVYLYPAEQVQVTESIPTRQFRLVSNAEEDRQKLISGLEGYKEQGLYSDGVWVTPGLPHLVFVTASLGVVLLLGDLLMMVFFRIVGYA